MRAVAYLSRTNTVFSEELDDLLLGARSYNDAQQVTGVLLYCTSFFFQYLEGEEHGVLKVYERIQQSHRHEIVLEVFNDTIEEKQFSNWCMGFCHAPEGVVQKLSQENWLTSLGDFQHNAHQSKGLEMLMTFWNNMNDNPSTRSS
jgi:hypothetical protein